MGKALKGEGWGGVLGDSPFRQTPEIGGTEDLEPSENKLYLWGRPEWGLPDYTVWVTSVGGGG